VLRVDIPRVPRRFEGTPWRRLLAYLRDGTTWRQVGYHLLALPIGVAGFVAVTVGWSVGIGLLLSPLYPGRPADGILGLRLRDPGTLTVLVLLGVLLLYATPWLVRALAAADARTARALLGPSRTEVLTRRVETLDRFRAGTAEAADAERRRIERDLHDGAQQRLVSLAMNLGMARAGADDLPEPARQAIESAHDEAKQALTELRDFVRGLHPAVLNDRGLDAALSGLVARSPVPVDLRVAVEPRCSPTIEAVAYFVVAEALTNIAKHAGATRAQVDVSRTGDRLLLLVRDDGRGGANAEAGGGLRGLAHRVAAVDGTLTLSSPTGGPTVLEVELPCES
jgi:signal transduction histidine kinase